MDRELHEKIAEGSGGMRFIVDLYKLIIYAVLAFIIITAVVGILELIRMGGASAFAMGMYLFAGVVGFVSLVVGLGILATFISIHDRHAELVEELKELRLQLSRGETVL
jgi:uncharacterized membrane protein